MLAKREVAVARIDKFSDFEELRSAWETVYQQDPEAQFFLSWKWLTGVLESFPGEWLVLVARAADDSRLGFLPLQLKTVWSKSQRLLRNELHFAGRLSWADYGGFLCLPAYEEIVLAAFASSLKQMNWSKLHMRNFRVSDRRFEIFMSALADSRLTVDSQVSTINGGATDNLVCPYVDLPETFEVYLEEKLSSNTRQKLRRFLRNLDSSSEYRITTASVETQKRDLQILETLWRRMWREYKGSKTESLAARYRKIIQRGLQDELVYLSLMWHRDNPIGVHASFIDRDKSRLLFFVGARDGAFSELPVGLLLHASNIRWAIANGLQTYDLLRGNEPYKYSLGAADMRLKYPVVRTQSGTNLNDKLDPGSLDQALDLADDSAARAVTVCQQVLATLPGEATAERLLEALAAASAKILNKTETVS